MKKKKNVQQKMVELVYQKREIKRKAQNLQKSMNEVKGLLNGKKV